MKATTIAKDKQRFEARKQQTLENMLKSANRTTILHHSTTFGYYSHKDTLRSLRSCRLECMHMLGFATPTPISGFWSYPTAELGYKIISKQHSDYHNR